VAKIKVPDYNRIVHLFAQMVAEDERKKCAALILKKVARR